MTLERVVWWIVLLWAFRHAWSANRKAEASSRASAACNPAGSIMIARCVQTIDKARRFAPIGSGFNVEGSHRFTIGERRFVMRVEEIGNDG